MITYTTVTVKDGAKMGILDKEDFHWVDDWANVLVRCENGEYEVVHVDGCMEPEDAILCRDLNKFVIELQRLANMLNTHELQKTAE